MEDESRRLMMLFEGGGWNGMTSGRINVRWNIRGGEERI